jgi:ferredoxin--NADP+ reductase
LEFYIALIRHGEKRPPALTPRLFALAPGARLFVSRHAAGRYTLWGVSPDDDLFFFSTGTGEAPHNAMVAELLFRGHRGRIVSAVSVRFQRDAAYRATHEELLRRFANYRYHACTTREPENIDPSRPDYVGKRYLQDLVRSGELERIAGVQLHAAHAHVFLCGNPTMIGAARQHESAGPMAQSGSMLDLLLQRGFQVDEPKRPGNVHFERYW